MKIAFVDEDPDQREIFSLLLQSCFPESPDAPQVVQVEPRPSMADMTFLVEDKEFVTIILDEQLKDSGIAQYFGIQLASYLRSLDKKIPIYILTSHTDSDDLRDGELNVEDILDKQTIHKKKDIVAARLLRRIDTYLDISTDRESRFEELLRKSISGNLKEEELREMNELGYLRSAPLEIDEIITSEQIRKIEELQAKVSEIEKSLNKKES